MNAPSQNARYSVAEEIAHAITHGLGFVSAIVALAVLVGYAAMHGHARHVTAVSVYGGSLVLLYGASTLYHSIPIPSAKRWLRLIDHAAIYFLIAGTYTPFTLITLKEHSGQTIFWIVWSIAAAGVAVELWTKGNARRLSLCLYLGMGWMALVLLHPLLESLDPNGLALIAMGGLSYTVGVLFYVLRRLKYHHAVWHLFVLAGSAAHFFAVLFYVLPWPD